MTTLCTINTLLTGVSGKVASNMSDQTTVDSRREEKIRELECEVQAPKHLHQDMETGQCTLTETDQSRINGLWHGKHSRL